MKKIFIIFAITLAVLAAAYSYLYFFTENFVAPVSSFEDCARVGYPVQESYPRRCVGPEGKTFTEDIGNTLEKADLIRVATPRPGDTVSSPFVAEGEARGYWYFEASFPVRVKDSAGNELGVGIAQAQSEWMTTEFVPFKAEVSFRTPTTATGTIVFEKDNPSGLPEHDDELRVPVRFY
ncbi:MAG: Gmad2 immunoglobulin-like domain-containing protein [Candidatus Pacebacteria bacterium]|nr:Gmad2 immunoglobulin-like domain-containing protein [Candidatus Paceibacterota bacterium]